MARGTETETKTKTEMETETETEMERKQRWEAQGRSGGRERTCNCVGRRGDTVCVRRNKPIIVVAVDGVVC